MQSRSRVKRRYRCRECSAKASRKYRAYRSEEQYEEALRRNREGKRARRIAQDADNLELVQRVIGILHDRYGYSYKQIAVMASCSMSTIQRLRAAAPGTKLTPAVTERIAAAFRAVQDKRG